MQRKHQFSSRKQAKGSDPALRAREGDFGLPNNETLNRQVLSFVEDGLERVKKYIKVNNLDVQHKVSRSEKEVSLLAITVTDLARTQERQNRIIKETSTNESKLKKKGIITIPELICAIEELSYTLNVDYEFDPPVMIDTKKMNKDDLVGALVELRKQYYDLDDQAKKRLTDEINNQCNNAQHDNSATGRLLTGRVYKLSDEILSKERYSIAPQILL